MASPPPEATQWRMTRVTVVALARIRTVAPEATSQAAPPTMVIVWVAPKPLAWVWTMASPATGGAAVVPVNGEPAFWMLRVPAPAAMLLQETPTMVKARVAVKVLATFRSPAALSPPDPVTAISKVEEIPAVAMVVTHLQSVVVGEGVSVQDC